MEWVDWWNGIDGTDGWYGQMDGRRVDRQTGRRIDRQTDGIQESMYLSDEGKDGEIQNDGGITNGQTERTDGQLYLMRLKYISKSCKTSGPQWCMVMFGIFSEEWDGVMWWYGMVSHSAVFCDVLQYRGMA